jgi:hypothetical protein
MAPKTLTLGIQKTISESVKKGRQSNLKEFPTKQGLKETGENKMISVSEHVDELRKY